MTKNIQTQTIDTQRKTLRSSLPLIAVPLSVMTIATLIVCGYIGVSILRDWDFTFYTFYTLTIPLVSIVIVSLFAIWRKRHVISTNTQLLMIEWASAVFWYWLIGIFYQFVTTNVNSDQLRIVSFGYYWEVFIIAGITYTISQIIFLPITKYLATGHTDDPERLYRRMLNFPINVAVRMSVFTIVGFTVGTMQVHFWADAPMIETIKNIGVGAVLSFFVALFQYLVIDSFMGPIRSRIIEQYKLEDVMRRKYAYKVFGVVLLLTLASLSLMIMIFMQSFQSITRDNLTANIQNDMQKSIERADTKGEPVTDNLQRGDNSKAWLLQNNERLPVDNVTAGTQARFQ